MKFFSSRTRITFPILSIILCITIINTRIHGVTAKTCVATALNRYLCTDDPEKARAHKWKDDPSSSFSAAAEYESLDLGEEQAMDGTDQEKEGVARVLSEMRDYFETEVLVKSEYDSVIDRW